MKNNVSSGTVRPHYGYIYRCTKVLELTIERYNGAMIEPARLNKENDLCAYQWLPSLLRVFAMHFYSL